MSDRRRLPRGLVAGGSLLGLVAVATILGPLALARDPERTLDPAATALAPPGSGFATLRLAAGYELAADRIVLDGDRFVLEDVRGRRTVPAREVDAARPVGRARFWLGSDALGRDVAARLLHGGRVSLAVALGAVLLLLLVGVPVGILAGLSRGLPDRALLGGIEAWQAFPRLFLLVALVAVVPAGVGTTVLLLGLTGWMPMARLVRAETRRLRSSEFVLAARAAGVGPARLALRHLVPNLVAPVAVEASLAMGAAITIEATLSFLGLGVPPPTPSWGNLIADGRELAASAWWIATFPGLALVATVVACSLVGEGLRDHVDPRHEAGRPAPL
ncbi:MAG TPA: ABC transporter permease [Thermoanaerobaculia bacterium]|nr:ABC transporter permease [Thermoanaerobaculia bacterium]